MGGMGWRYIYVNRKNVWDEMYICNYICNYICVMRIIGLVAGKGGC